MVPSTTKIAPFPALPSLNETFRPCFRQQHLHRCIHRVGDFLPHHTLYAVVVSKERTKTNIRRCLKPALQQRSRSTTAVSPQHHPTRGTPGKTVPKAIREATCTVRGASYKRPCTRTEKKWQSARPIKGAPQQAVACLLACICRLLRSPSVVQRSLSSSLVACSRRKSCKNGGYIPSPAPPPRAPV